MNFYLKLCKLIFFFNTQKTLMWWCMLVYDGLHMAKGRELITKFLPYLFFLVISAKFDEKKMLK
jgi:hypothetical protein